MKLSQFKPFKQYSFYDNSIYNQIFENITTLQNETLLYNDVYCCMVTAPQVKQLIRLSYLHTQHAFISERLTHFCTIHNAGFLGTHKQE